MNDKPILNLGLIAHVDAGKTTLSEAMLFESGSRRTLGRVVPLMQQFPTGIPALPSLPPSASIRWG